MYVIVGLGNPDRKYLNTRHNCGFLAIDLLADALGIDLNKRACKCVLGEGRLNGQRIVLAKPVTYMNLSGEAVVELLNWYKIDQAEELIVIYDDIDLPVGEIRIRGNGSAGSHNGMKSILYLTGSDVFPRIRVGIDRQPTGWDLANYVLGEFRPEEKEAIVKGLENAADAAKLIATEGLKAAQSKYNVKKRKKKEAQASEPAEKAEETEPNVP